MDLIFAIVFAYFYSIFYYAIPINLIPSIILYSLRKRSFSKTLIASLFFGIVLEIPYPNKIWISPIFYVILCYIISLLRQEIILLVSLLLVWLISFELIKLILDFRTSYLIISLRVFLTTLSFLLTWQYLKNY